jgi:LacI family transcriptional regulator
MSPKGSKRLASGSDRPPNRPAAATIRDVAAAAGVSIATVSAVLNGTPPVSPKRSKLIRDAIASLGYAPHGPARSLRLGKTKAIGIVVGDIANPFFTSLIRIVEQRASEAGYFVIVANSDDDVDKEINLLRLFREQRVAGILLAPAGHDEAYVSTLRTMIDVPVVLVDRQLPDAPFDTVVINNVKAAQMVTEYLVRLGHRRIAIVIGKQHLWTTTQRFDGFREGLRQAHIDPDTDLECIADSRIDAAYRIVQKLLVMPNPPSAIFAANNLMMLGAIEAVIDMGYRCPDDVSIAGIDDLPWISAIRPKLTTVSQPIDLLGANALDMLLERVRREEEQGDPLKARITTLEPQFIIRDSCARVNTASVKGRKPATPKAQTNG